MIAIVKTNCINLQLMNTPSFGKMLTLWREKANLSQNELSKRVGVSVAYISNLERDYSPTAKDNIARPSVKVVDKLSKTLGVPTSEARLAAGYAPKVIEKPDNEQIDDLFEELKGLVQFSAKEYDDPERAEQSIMNDVMVAARVAIEMNKPKMPRKKKLENK